MLSSQLLTLSEPVNTTKEIKHEDKIDVTADTRKTETEFKCDVCGKKLKTASNLNTNINKFHKDQENNKCTYCAQKFPNDKSLQCIMLRVKNAQ